MKGSYLGPQFSNQEIKDRLSNLGAKFHEFDDNDKNLTRAWLRTKGNSIEGGTSEVQLNVISKRVLGLPSQ